MVWGVEPLVLVVNGKPLLSHQTTNPKGQQTKLAESLTSDGPQGSSLKSGFHGLSSGALRFAGSLVSGFAHDEPHVFGGTPGFGFGFR